jgi:carbon storage regulator
LGQSGLILHPIPGVTGAIMLVLTRKIGEEIVISDNIRIMVVAIKGDKVRIGINAPIDVVVDRQEVHDKRRNALSDVSAVMSTTILSEDLPLTGVVEGAAPIMGTEMDILLEGASNAFLIVEKDSRGL